jgi:hypothetical protein
MADAYGDLQRLHVEVYRGPQSLCKYVANYVSGTAISDRRIVSDDGQFVTIKIHRYTDGTNGTITISGKEFVRRFCLHLLPRGTQRVRYAGLFTPKKRQPRIDHCRKLIVEGMAGRGEDVRDIAITVPPIGSPAEIKVAIGISCKTCDHKMIRTAHISPRRTMFFIKQALLLVSAVTTGVLDKAAELILADQQQREIERIERTRILLTPPESLSHTIEVENVSAISTSTDALIEHPGQPPP